MYSHMYCFVFSVWARKQKACPSYLCPLSLCLSVDVDAHKHVYACAHLGERRGELFNIQMWVSACGFSFFQWWAMYFFSLACLSTQHGTNRHSASHSALQLAENHGKNIDKQRWNNSCLARRKALNRSQMLSSSRQCISAGASPLCQTNYYALETHQTEADASACLFKHLLKVHIGHLCGCCCWNRSLSGGGCFILVHTVLWQCGPGAAAHSFMSEPETRTAATTRAEKLHHPANTLIHPELAAE